MALIVPKDSLQEFTQMERNYWNFTGFRTMIRLFQSAFTIDEDTLLADLEAIECDFIGYAAIPATGWADVGFDIDGRLIHRADAVTFTLTLGTQDVYGYFVTREDTGDLLWAENDPLAPVVLSLSNTDYIMRPRQTIGSEF